MATEFQPLKLSDIRPGTKLRADEAFTCLPHGHMCEVHEDEHGLYVHCCGPEGAHTNYADKHFLDGQLNDDGEIVGFELVRA